MRTFLLFPLAVVLPVAIFFALQTVTGDPLSAVILGLLLLTTVGAWFGGPAMATGRLPIEN